MTLAVSLTGFKGWAMRNVAETTSLERARQAASTGDWKEACELFVEADASTPLTPPDLALLAGVAYAAGRVDTTIDAWERASIGSTEAGDPVSAAGAAVRVAMHLLFDVALMAPVRSWLTRADRLLAGHENTPVHAWLAAVRSYERLLSGDFAGAREWAQNAILAGAAADPAAAALGRVAHARILILQGDVAQGVALLNEAAMAAVTGEIDPLSTGVIYCEVVCAFHALGQYDLAEQWTNEMDRWRHGRPVGSVHGRCRIHRAEILRLRGACSEAESEILTACDELRPYLRREFGWPLTELGRIRLRLGDIERAEEAFIRAHEAGWDPQPGLALVYLARGDVARAVASIRDALDRPSTVPSKEWPPNTQLRRAPLLEAGVEIELAAGDIERARSAATELAAVASLFQSKALAGAAAVAWGRVRLADGDATSSVREFEIAVQHWNDIGAPYETAVARIGLSDALRAAGKEERAFVERRAARAAFDRIGVSHHDARAAQAAGATTRDDVSPNAFQREGDFWSIVFDGRTTRLRDSKGLQYLARLLADPGREIHVLDLTSAAAVPVSSHDGQFVRDLGDAGELLDPRAKDAYRRRLRETEQDLQDARVLADETRAAQVEIERDFLLKELARAVGLGGRDRRAGSASERARSAVTRAIRQALNRLEKHDRPLADHLARTVRTGAHCAYVSDTRVPGQWKL